MSRQLLRGIALIGAVLLLAGCGEPEQISLDGKTMGTYYVIKYVNKQGTPAAQTLQAEIDRRLEEVNAQMSTYRADSELSRFNQSREINTPFPVSAATRKVVQEAMRLNALTEGALDVTVGPLVNLWGFGPEGQTDRSPSEEELAKRRQWVGSDKLQVSEQGLVKSLPELYVDLSAIAKGYGVDVVADYLESQNIDSYMVDIGGDGRTRGQNQEGIPWRIAIEKPLAGGVQMVQEVIQPGDLGFATSGDYRNYFEQDGVRYSHTIDPVTGRPITHRLVSVTVLAPSGMTADGLATGLNVLGPEAGLALANQQGIPVLMVVKTDTGFEGRMSEAFKPYLQQKKQSEGQ